MPKKKKINRIMIAAPGSGSGKTTIVCGLLQLLKKRNNKVSSFKCGPDYIDPMFHRSVIGVEAHNIDTFFTEESHMRYLFTKEAENCDIAVIEGVMGYYDGQSMQSMKASTYDLAVQLQSPVILIVNGKGAGLSIAALIKGFLEFREPNMIAGILLNQISETSYPKLKECIEKELGIPVVGFLPYMKEMHLRSRHLGLVMPEEYAQMEQQLMILSQKMEKTIDIDHIMEIAAQAPFLTVEEPISLGKMGTNEVTIGVAKDAAFCFYYQENLELMQEMGARLVYFSPLSDLQLPEEIDGLLLGGGYPELHAKTLSENETMIKSIRKALENGLPCIAECGGFLYLQNSMEDEQNSSYNMVGFLDGTSKRATKRERFGYINVTLKEDSILGEGGTKIPAHEFHYWESSDTGRKAIAEKPDRIRKWECMRIKQNTVAGFPHFYLHGNRNAAWAFLNACKKYHKLR